MEDDAAHHTVTLRSWRGCWWKAHGFSADQYRMFCLFTAPLRWKYASSLMRRLFISVRCWFVNCIKVWLNSKRVMLSPSKRHATCILYGQKFKSWCKMHLTLLPDVCNAMLPCWSLRIPHYWFPHSCNVLWCMHQSWSARWGFVFDTALLTPLTEPSSDSNIRRRIMSVQLSKSLLHLYYGAYSNEPLNSINVLLYCITLHG